MKNLFLLDAYALIYRSYFAFISRPLKNPEGENVSAVFGFFRTVFQLWEQYSPGAMAAVFDPKTPTFRHELYPEYKATRQKTPDDLHAQVPLVEELLGLLGIPVLVADGYEADDLIATLADRCRAENRPCYIVSGDKDLLQLVGGPVKALKPDRDAGWLEMDSDGVKEAWGVRPEQILDYLSFTGDSSDNVPGVPGVGDKTALKLMEEYGSFDAVWAALDSIKPEGLKKKLVAGKESAFLSRKLISLVRDLPLSISNLDELNLETLQRENADPVFLRHGMRSLVSSPAGSDLALGSDLDSGGQTSLGLEIPIGYKKGQPPTPPPAEPTEQAGTWEVVRDAKTLEKWVRAAEKAGVFAFDTETDSLDEMRTLPVGFSLSIDGNSAIYVPLKSPEADMIPTEDARRIMAPLLANRGLTLIGQNIKFDMHIMENWGCPIHNRLFDTMIAAWLIDSESGSLKLEYLAQSYLGFIGTEYSQIAPRGTRFSEIWLDQAAPYAAEDAWLCIRLKNILEKKLEEEKLSALFYDVEMPLLRILARMERAGILVDTSCLELFGKELEAELSTVQTETWRVAGKEFNLNSPKQLQEILFVDRKLSGGKKTKTGYSTDISVLEELAKLDPVPELILRHRSMQKLKSTYVDSLLELSRSDPRIHSHFIQTGTATGRLSSREPNLQNIPVREEEGRRIRKAFIAPQGYKLISADYSQIELVVFAHLSQDPELKKAFTDGADIHRRTAALILGKDEDAVDAADRRMAKTINFGVIYGMGAFRLSNELGISRANAQEFIDAYFSRYSGVAHFIDRTIEDARRDGYTSTILGRRRPIPTINSRNGNERQAAERVAVNSPIQGSAADIMKLAMLKLDSLLEKEFPKARLLLQVHDELILEAPEDDAEKLAAALEKTMSSAYSLSVPMRVSVEIKDNWGEMH